MLDRSATVETCLCIGGPQDGKRVTASAESDSLEFVFPPTPAEAKSPVQSLAPIGRTRYRRAILRGSRVLFAVYVWEHLDADHALDLLLTNYPENNHGQ